MLKRTRTVAAALLASCSAAYLSAQSAATWTPTWAAAQTAAYGSEVLPEGALSQATLREVVHLSAGGRRIKLKISNVFGASALRLNSVHVALRARTRAPGMIDAATDRTALFGGAKEISIPAGAEYLTDPVDLPVDPLSDLVVSLEIEQAPTAPTLHAGARATSFLTKGSFASAAVLPTAQAVTRWYFLSGVEVQGSSRTAGALIALGDSITDGHGATLDGNDRWPDVLSARLNGKGSTTPMSVLNAGIGGNRILEDGIGPNAMARLERDVLSQPDVHTLLVLEGINDLGVLDRTEAHAAPVHDALVEALKIALRDVIERAHEKGIRVLGGTLTPFEGSGYYHPGPASERDRVRLNDWIRRSNAFDGVVDFDTALRDPEHPSRLLPAYDSGDHLHPGPKGYERMGQVVPLALLH